MDLSTFTAGKESWESKSARKVGAAAPPVGLRFWRIVPWAL